MTIKYLNHEGVAAHVESVDLAAIKALPQPQQLCGYWTAARPIVLLLASLPILPSQWKTIVAGLVASLDLFCPVKP